MDEPFASVDAQDQGRVEDLVLRVRNEQEDDGPIWSRNDDIDERRLLGDGCGCCPSHRRPWWTRWKVDLPAGAGPDVTRASVSSSG